MFHGAEVFPFFFFLTGFLSWSRLTNMEKEICRVPGCDRPTYIRKHRLCRGHYLRYWQTGDPGTTPIQPRRQHPAYQPKKTRRMP